MTLLDCLLKKVHYNETHPLDSKLHSPPPEMTKIEAACKKTTHKNKYASVKARVDSSPPWYHFTSHVALARHCRQRHQLLTENMRILAALRRAGDEGKVDCHWRHPLPEVMRYYKTRCDFVKQNQIKNRKLHKLFSEAKCRVEPTTTHNTDWKRNRREIIKKSQKKFILFPVNPTDTIEDPAFRPSKGFRRPRVRIELRVKGGCSLGSVQLELFTDVCPRTCQLFLELLTAGSDTYSYINSIFFRKVPNLYWTGGDVVYDNGCGCYAQRGRLRPIGAENYTFAHSIPGLLSMRVTRNDEVCGIFNVTFKPLPQFDLKNVVFGRVVRPNSTYEAMRSLGEPLSSRPQVYISGCKI